jgi:hypothetical protein
MPESRFRLIVGQLSLTEAISAAGAFALKYGPRFTVAATNEGYALAFAHDPIVTVADGWHL